MNEFEDFVLFVVNQMRSGHRTETVEELVRQWRLTSETAGMIADVRQGIADDALGLAYPIEDVFAEIRNMLGVG